MNFGISMFPTDYAIRPDELTRALEERGFESLADYHGVAKIPVLRQAMAKAGRDPKSLSVSIFRVKPDRAAVDPLAGAGVDRIVFKVPSETPDKVLPLLDAYAAVTR